MSREELAKEQKLIDGLLVLEDRLDELVVALQALEYPTKELPGKAIEAMSARLRAWNYEVARWAPDERTDW